MDEWTKMLLGQGGAVAMALDQLERSNRMNLPVAGSGIDVALVAEYRRALLPNFDLERAMGMPAGLMPWPATPYHTGVERSAITELLRAQEASQHHLATFSASQLDEAASIAEWAQTRTLHASLEPFRTSIEPFVSKLLHLQSLDTIRSPAYLDAFIQASTISDMFDESMRVDSQLQAAMRQFAQVSVPKFDILDDYRQFLDAAGFRLSHWPHIRLLTIGEKRRRFRHRLNKMVEPVHVKKAKSLVQRYELTLREILVDAMEREYGEDWPDERLPLCKCNDLLGKWKKRGGQILGHADYFHYSQIMSHPEHFEAVFGLGFSDPTAIATLIDKAGTLRATLQHFHPFSFEDLRDLRLTWRAIETGLLALTADYDIETWN